MGLTSDPKPKRTIANRSSHYISILCFSETSNTSATRRRVLPRSGSGPPGRVISPQSSHKSRIILAETRLTVWIGEPANRNLVDASEERIIAMLKCGNLHALACNLIKLRFVDNPGENEDIILHGKIVGMRQPQRATATFCRAVNLIPGADEQHTTLACANEGVVNNYGILRRPD